MTTKPTAKKPVAPAKAKPPAPKTSDYFEVPVLIQITKEGEFEAAAWSKYPLDDYADELFSGELEGPTHSCWVTIRIPKAHIVERKYVYEVPSK